MKITKKILEKLIKEEVAKAVHEDNSEQVEQYVRTTQQFLAQNGVNATILRLARFLAQVDADLTKVDQTQNTLNRRPGNQSD